MWKSKINFLLKTLRRKCQCKQEVSVLPLETFSLFLRFVGFFPEFALIYKTILETLTNSTPTPSLPGDNSLHHSALPPGEEVHLRTKSGGLHFRSAPHLSWLKREFQSYVNLNITKQLNCAYR